MSVFLRRLALFLLGFVVFFCLRLGYGYVTSPNGEPIGQSLYQPQSSYNFEISRKNYAGQKGGGSVGPSAVDQRYEKVATLGQVTSTFDADEARVRDFASEAGALIQHELAFGLEGRRQLQLALGVAPDDFEGAIETLRGVGRAVSFQVNKTDKTNEYRELLARQESLKTARDNLMALKSREAELGDLIALEARILELESQIQSLGVSVGEFDSEFEFVTVKLTLSEVAPERLRDISFMRRAKTALEWAVQFYALLCVAFALFALGSAASLWTWRKLKETPE